MAFHGVWRMNTQALKYQEIAAGPLRLVTLRRRNWDLLSDSLTIPQNAAAGRIVTHADHDRSEG
jgi:hypothetical protein